MIRSTFMLPAGIAAASVLGLVIALTGDGWRDAVSWISLALPIAAVCWALRRSARARRSS